MTASIFGIGPANGGRIDFTRYAGDFTRHQVYWNEPQYYRSIRIAQLDPNDARLQVIALTPNGLGVWAYDPSDNNLQWKNVSTYSAISPATGWALPQSYLTLQSAVVQQSRTIFLGRGPANLVTLAYDAHSGLAPATKPGFPAISTSAYQWISQQLPHHPE